MNIIENIVSNLELRNSLLSDKLFVESFKERLDFSLLSPLRELVSEKLSCSPIFAELRKFEGGVTLTKLEGFDKPVRSNDFKSVHEISVEFQLGQNLDCVLSAEINECFYGDGSDIESWSLFINDEDIEDFAGMSDVLEASLTAFLTNNYDGSNYDISLIEVDDQVIKDFAKALGVEV